MYTNEDLDPQESLMGCDYDDPNPVEITDPGHPDYVPAADLAVFGGEVHG